MIRQLPNTLTTLRLLSAPLLAAFLLYGHQTYAFVVFAFAGLTDAADGFVAKRFGLMTRVGRYLDPAADKFLMLVAFLALTAIHQTPLWLTLIVIGRDIGIVLGILVARLLALPLRIEPLPIGKFCTAVQVAYVALVLLFLALRIEAPRTLEAAAIVAAAFTIASWLAYAILWLKAFAARYRPAA
ncbi:MAG TPA: CDP-alcohol phosphatidyltransferase family protein [Rhizomicrobium sp.]|jgi:cardiolipin synthase|nr:CDP-alcohol phosphatidyltransferase family protein [Rhizomicrobium sp.]